MEFHLKVSLKGDITCERETTILFWNPSTIQKTTVSVQSTSLCVVVCHVKTASSLPQDFLILILASPKSQFSRLRLVTLARPKKYLLFVSNFWLMGSSSTSLNICCWGKYRKQLHKDALNTEYPTVIFVSWFSHICAQCAKLCSNSWIY